MSVLRVLVVDDQDLVRAGFVALLSATPDLEVVGEAGQGARRPCGWPVRPARTWC